MRTVRQQAEGRKMDSRDSVKTNYEITDCEMEVYAAMTQMQHAGAELNMRDITDYINRIYKKGWKTQTVSTFLARLRRKGLIGMERRGRIFVYELYADLDGIRMHIIRKYADILAGGDTAAFCRLEAESGEENA